GLCSSTNGSTQTTRQSAKPIPKWSPELTDHEFASLGNPMARWPDDTRSTATTAVLIFMILPALCWLAWRYVRG
ncbi:MAG: hypothetical protein NT069_10550, partial [Planctomycetota bacterium]|nr:hypothetical protein [Planctomycetota bacterium]